MAINAREKQNADRILIRVEMGIYKLDQQRQLDHNDFINKDKDFLSNIKELKDQMIKMTNEQEVKSKFLIDETHKTLESSYTELQDTI